LDVSSLNLCERGVRNPSRNELLDAVKNVIVNAETVKKNSITLFKFKNNVIDSMIGR